MSVAALAPRSLRWRLLAATLAGLALALALAWWTLAGLFREHVQRQFEAQLAQQLDQLTARLEFDAAGQPRVDALALSDPRWQQPYAGLYWQLDAMAPGAAGRQAVLRSRSLWDTQLQLSTDTLADGRVHVHEAAGPRSSRVLLLERTVRAEETGDARWRLVVAADMAPLQAAQEDFRRVLGASLAALMALLAAAAWAQVGLGLRPLDTLRRSLREVQEARAPRLAGRFPSEVQPLVDDFNRVLDHHDQVVERARTQAGNLAHALKTPLAVLSQVAARAPAGSEWGAQVQAQVTLAQRQVDRHLAQARLAAAGRVPGQRCTVGPVVRGLARVMERVHADKGLSLVLDLPEEAPDFAGQEADLQEILGNLMDNACKWGYHQVTLSLRGLPAGDALEITVEDDGPGIPAEAMAAAMGRGVRLDESVPGSGLGLAIVREGVDRYGGTLRLSRGSAGGLRVVVQLPGLPALPARPGMLSGDPGPR